MSSCESLSLLSWNLGSLQSLSDNYMDKAIAVQVYHMVKTSRFGGDLGLKMPSIRPLSIDPATWVNFLSNATFAAPSSLKQGSVKFIGESRVI